MGKWSCIHHLISPAGSVPVPALGKALIPWGNQEIEKCARRLSPIDDDCHIKYTKYIKLSIF